ncbi:DegV family protein [Clostridium saccharoperbutylacetonicum]|uniref:DegV family protein n=1 Tax=Clostridium saccharoperbutylacetonicum TaxID=36745 RepID=UPI0039EA0D7A
MNTKIIVDSCVDFNSEAFGNEEEYMERVPFKILIDDEEIIDRNLDINSLLQKMKSSKNKIGTACPSPNDFLEALKKCKNNFIVTISSKLSGSYNSALLAKEMLKEELPDSFVHVFDTQSAVSGPDLIVLRIKQLIEEKASNEEIVEKVTKYIDEMRTLFVLEKLDNLAKNGRISNAKALMGTLLQIIPIMSDNGNGEIILREQVRGKKKAFNRLVEMIGEETNDFKNKVIGIGHVNAREKAERFKDEISNRYNFKDIIIFEGGGLSTVYADDGGIVICF